MADLKGKLLKDIGYQKGQFDIKKQMVKNTFGGDDLLSSIIRDKLGVKKEKKDKSPSKEGEGINSAEATSVLVVIAKNTMFLPGMAKDVKNLSQNIQKLVKLKGGKPTSSASEFFRKQKEKGASKLKLGKSKSPTSGGLTKSAPKEGGGVMGFLGDIVSFIGGALVEVVKSLFNPMVLLRILGRLAIPALIISTLFSGIMAGWKKYDETGNFGDAIVSYFGGMLEFLTFGLLGEDTVKAHNKFMKDLFFGVLDTLTKVFDSVKSVFKNIFGDFIKIDDKPVENPTDTKLEKPPEGSAAGSTSTAGSVTPQQTPAQSAMNQASANFIAPKATAPVSEPAPVEVPVAASPTPVVKKSVSKSTGKNNEDLNDELSRKEDELQSLNDDYKEEKAAVKTQLAKTTDSFIDNPKKPGYAPELKAVDEKYKPKIEKVKNEIEALKKKGAKVSLNAESDDEDFDVSPTPTPTTTKQVTKTTAVESTSGGGSTTRRASKKSLEDAAAYNKKQREEEDERERQEMGGGSGSSAASLSGNSSSNSSSPSPQASAPSISGPSISSASSEVAEGQRMESAADNGNMISAGTTNNTSSSFGKPSKQTASAYDDEFAQRLAVR